MSVGNLQGLKLEFHILQSFPVTCLNRDDVGAPKTAIVGGTTRARVSSQAWKRQVRMELHNLGIKLGVRTKRIKELIVKKMLEQGASDEQAETCAIEIAKHLSKDTLHFFTDQEAEGLAEYAKSLEYKASDIKKTDVYKEHKKFFNPAADGLDIALFGRMVAQAPELNIEASCSFSHAISTHKVNNELDFFTAIDDYPDSDEIQTGSSHMGTLEFNSATYYRYISVNLGQLVDTLGEDGDINSSIMAFIKALYLAVPQARQTTQAGFNQWDYAKVYLRKGQNLQVCFDKAVKSKGDGYLSESISTLDQALKSKESKAGSLFGKVQEWTWGLDDSYSMDDLIEGITSALEGVH
ncbi:type I-E CRISPR-associated protein Cas7/Cse4/CasC [Spirochaeta cellobiosiphila]|uniref:type I-E CRISPR-associated protein Cas7/Cse4/CasC n=1 Tax=Spirochaeta cellobiosiphila TaxID=504483 RepID=UPI0003F61BDA|nr:type I-E CRISPR-associated protein Cas7/Cse4/CasC [Spirochaeta cellobiosiphila]